MSWPAGDDTIAAISTPLGEAGIGVVRLSGPQAKTIARRLFRPHRPRSEWQSHRLYLGHLLDAAGNLLDEVLLAFMQAPHSYTREDMVEIQCHSGYGVLKAILQVVLAEGARLARPGEFTLRAFLSGRLDLPQAEAVLEVIAARTESALRVAQAHLAGGVARLLAGVRSALLEHLARVEAALDFPEEGGEIHPEALAAGLAESLATLERLLNSHRQGRLLREGVRVVLAGRPNVGKSSLLNRLLATDRAIVTDLPGTTRDVIEETLNLGGLPLRLSDTAGLREARDRVEEMGIARSRESLAQADLILYLVDGGEPLAGEDLVVLQELSGRPVLVVVNKLDLPRRLDSGALRRERPGPLVEISALTGQGLAELESAVLELVLGGRVSTTGEIITQARHHELLGQARESLSRAQALLAGAKPPWELVALELQEALQALGRITGEEVGDDLLDQIFSQFCIGK